MILKKIALKIMETPSNNTIDAAWKWIINELNGLYSPRPGEAVTVDIHAKRALPCLRRDKPPSKYFPILSAQDLSP
ncbi:MAG: hypothetical protein R6U64_08325 [Bacteroidales bacterium]